MKTLRKVLALSFFTASSLFISGAARAQQSVDLIMDNFTSSVLSQTTVLLNNAAIESSMRNANSKRSAKASLPKITLSYTPTKTLQQKTLQELGNKLQARNPVAGQTLFNVFGPGKADYSQLFTQMVQQSGLPANNAATALAALLEVGYVIVNNVQNTSSITPAVDRALQQQAAGLLSQNKKLTSPAIVSKLGEELKLQSVVLYLGWQSALKNSQVNDYSSAIAKQFKGMGFDLSQVRLTSKGFVKK